MALIFAEGFDDFVNFADIATSAASFGTDVSVVTGRGGNGKGISNDQHGPAIYAFTPSATVIAGFALTSAGGNIGAGGNTTDCGYVAFLSNGTTVASIQQYAAAAVAFFDSTNDPVSSGIAVGNLGNAAFLNWSSYIEVHVTPGNPGTLTVKIDGVQVFTTAVANLSAATTINQISFGASRNLTTKLDDLYVCDGTGTTNNTFLGDTRILSVPPNADGAESQLTQAPAAASQFTNVSEATIDYATTNNNATAAAQTDTYLFAALTGNGIIRAVQVRAYATTAVGGVDKLAGVARIAGTDHASPDQFVHAVYTALDSIFETNPATAVAWTQAGLNAAEFGVTRTV